MRVVGTFHPSSSVSCSVKCNLSADAAVEYLVVAKTDRLEVFSCQQDGLKKECSKDMWGTVVGLQAVPAEESGLCHLLVMTGDPNPDLIVMAYEVEDGIPNLVPKSSLSLAERGPRRSEFVTGFAVDPTGSVIVASYYTGKLKVAQLTNGQLGNEFDVSLPELHLLSFTFLRTDEDRLTLGLLHLNHQRHIQLLSRDLDLDEFEVSSSHSSVLATTLLRDKVFPATDPAPVLVPVASFTTGSEEEDDAEDSAAHRGGVLVLGGRKIVFYEHTSKNDQEIRKGKQRRISKRLASDNPDDVRDAKKKQAERENRILPPRASVKWPWAAITAWCPLDDHGRRFLLGDAFGRLAMLAFDDKKTCLLLLPIGETSSPTCMTYLSSQVLYLGSHSGDAQLLRIHPTPIGNTGSDTLPIPKGVSTVPPSSLSLSSKGKGKVTTDSPANLKDGRVVLMKGTYLEVLQSYDNIAPILDAILEDIDGSGQPQVITCSGTSNTGSLRVIRTEADFKEQARFGGMLGITDIWPVKKHSSDPTSSHLVLSTLRETFVFSFSEQDTIANLDPASLGFATNMPTFAVGNVPRRGVAVAAGRSTSTYEESSLIVQITSEGIRLIEYDNTLSLFTRKGEGWILKNLKTEFANRQVVAASMSPSQYVVGLSGGRLGLLNLGPQDDLQLVKHRDFIDEICAISCNPFDPTKPYATMLAVSFWGSNTVTVVALDGPQGLSTKYDVLLPALPRSLLLHNFGKSARAKDPDFHPYLLAGLADGTLVTFALREGKLADKKMSSLGGAPVSLSVCAADGRTVVFASGARTNILFWDRERLQTSPVAVKDVVKGVTLNTPAYSSCLALATSSGFLIGNVRGLDKMQIRTIMLGADNPRSIAYYAPEEVFGVACLRTTPGRIGDLEDVKGSFKLMDARTFKELHEYPCKADEWPTSVLALPDIDCAGPSPAFCLGSVVMRLEETEPSKGYLTIFGISSAEAPRGGTVRNLRVLASKEVVGCPYAVVRMSDQLIAAGVNTAVMIFRIRDAPLGGSTPLVLEELATWNHNYFVTQLAFDGEHLIVGDAISSICAVRWDEKSGRVESVARDYGPVWPVAVASTGKGAIVANSDCNLLTFTLQKNAQRSVLEKDGVYQLGDVVNKIVPGALSSTDATDDRAVKPGHVFFTSTGRIGAILEMDDEVALHMTALERNMSKTLVGPGDVNHTKRRAPSNARGLTDAESAAYGFLDGDFLETFLSHPAQEDFMTGDIEAERITLPVADVKDILVQMQSLH